MRQQSHSGAEISAHFHRLDCPRAGTATLANCIEFNQKMDHGSQWSFPSNLLVKSLCDVSAGLFPPLPFPLFAVKDCCYLTLLLFPSLWFAFWGGASCPLHIWMRIWLSMKTSKQVKSCISDTAHLPAGAWSLPSLLWEHLELYLSRVFHAFLNLLLFLWCCNIGGMEF